MSDTEAGDDGAGHREDPAEPAGDAMDPEAWYGEPDVCGSCIAWKPMDRLPTDDVAHGVCRLRAELGRVPADLKLCSLYKPRGRFVYRPSPERPGKRRSAAPTKVLRRSSEGELVVAKEAPRPRAPEELRPPPPREIDLGEANSAPIVRQALVELVRSELGRSKRELLPRFKGGTVELRRGDDTRAPLGSVERLFSMVDRLRSSLDALENALSRASGLGPDSAELVDSVRKIHGSLTTFNLLYAHKEDQFSSK